MRGRTLLFAGLLLAAAFAGCLGDADNDATNPTNDTDQNPNASGPTYDLPESITGMENVSRISHGSAAGLVDHDGYAYVAGQGAGFYVVDIHDPQNATKIAHLEEITARDADVITVNGSLHVALANGGSGLHMIDVADPTNPIVKATNFDVGQSVHNLVTIPGTSLIYNSRSLGTVGDTPEPGDTPGGITIINVSDPAEPVVEKVWQFPPTGGMSPVATTGCHDIAVYPEDDRAYCAGVTQTYIMDIEDPMNPSVLGTVSNPAINIHHWAVATNNHSTLIIGDEFAGAAGPPSCIAHQSTPVGDVSQPYGGIWFYDISDPSTPTPQGFLSAPTHTEAAVCTAHFGDFIPGHDMMAVGWYTAGVLLVDFSDPTMPTLVDQWGEGNNVWDVRYHNGHLITGDIGHGTDILQLTGS